MALTALALLLLGTNAVYRAGFGRKERTDLTVYLAASSRLLDGQDPVGVTNSRGWPYYYPPTLAVALVPLVPLPLPAAAAVWYAIGAAALVAGAVAARRAVDEALPWDRWDALALALVTLPAASALLRGQMGPVLLGLCGGALLLLARRRDVSAGALLGLAAALKLTPAALLLALALERRWRAVAASVASAVVCLVLLPAPFLGVAGAARSSAGSVGVVLGLAGAPVDLEVPTTDGDPVVRKNVHIPTNQSLASQVIRRLPEGNLQSATVWLLIALALGASVPLALRGRVAATTALALLLAAPLLVAPVAWHHHHVVLLPALLLLAGHARQGDRAARGALAAFALLSLTHFAATPLREWGLLGWGTLAVFVVVAARAWTRPAPGDAAGGAE
jgi:alpha-1,2-mannosyltransferase